MTWRSGVDLSEDSDPDRAGRVPGRSHAASRQAGRYHSDAGQSRATQCVDPLSCSDDCDCGRLVCRPRPAGFVRPDFAPPRSRSRSRSLLSFQTSRRLVALLALSAFAICCNERMTPGRAGTIIRHSKAFLSGAPGSQPVFDGVMTLSPSSEGATPERQEGDFYFVEFSYHWPESSISSRASGSTGRLTARVWLHRTGGSWTVDDDRSRGLSPSWPQLPRQSSPDPFGRGLVASP
jgi:hypothetical protein